MTGATKGLLTGPVIEPNNAEICDIESNCSIADRSDDEEREGQPERTGERSRGTELAVRRGPGDLDRCPAAEEAEVAREPPLDFLSL